MLKRVRRAAAWFFLALWLPWQAAAVPYSGTFCAGVVDFEISEVSAVPLSFSPCLLFCLLCS